MKRTHWEQDRYRQKRPVELMRAFRAEVEALREVRRIVIEDNANLFGTVQCNEVRIADLEAKLLSASNTIATLTDQRAADADEPASAAARKMISDLRARITELESVISGKTFPLECPDCAMRALRGVGK